MKKRLISLVMAVLMLATMVPVTAFGGTVTSINSADFNQFTKTLPVLSSDKAECFIAMLCDFNANKRDDEDIIRADDIYKLLTGNYSKYNNSIFALKMDLLLFTQYARTVIGSRAEGYSKNADRMAELMIDMAMEIAPNPNDSELTQGVINEISAHYKKLFTESLVSYSAGLIGYLTGLDISDNVLADITDWGNLWNSTIGGIDKAQEIANAYVTGVYSVFHAASTKMEGIYSYLTGYINFRKSYEVNDPAFKAIMAYNCFAVTQNKDILSAFCEWIDRSIRSEDLIPILEEWGEFIIQCEKAIENESAAEDIIIIPLNPRLDIVYGDIWDGKSKTPAPESSGVYTVSTGAQLAWIAEETNSGNTFAGKIIYLSTNIDLNAKAWTSIGTELHPFEGIFCGNNYAIGNLSVSGGLFGCLSGNAFVCNLQMLNAVTRVDGGWSNVADTGVISSIVDLKNGAGVTITNCSIRGNIRGDGHPVNAGSVIGRVSASGSAQLILSQINCDVTLNAIGGLGGTTNAGSLIGAVEDNSRNSEIRISRCNVNGTFVGSTTYSYSTSYTGGLIGFYVGNRLYIDQCAVSGDVSATAYSPHCGGFIGNADYNRLVITNSMVKANLTSTCTNGQAGVGGFLGQHICNSNQSLSSIENCYIAGSMTAYVKSGFVAWNESSSTSIPIKCCYFDMGKTGITNASYMIVELGMLTTRWINPSSCSTSTGYSSLNMKKQSSYVGWDFDSIWEIGSSGYPELRVLDTYNTPLSSCGGEDDRENLTWALDDVGVLSITGEGQMKDYSNSTTPWYSNRSGIKKAEIGDSVTTIGDYAFSNCSRLIATEIPGSVMNIGDYAFYNCISLGEVTIGDSVTIIGNSTFEYCSSMTSITIPDSVISIGKYAFYDCSSLSDVYYRGTKDQWNSIDINPEGNDFLINTNIHFLGEPVIDKPTELAADNFKFTARSLALENTITVTYKAVIGDEFKNPYVIFSFENHDGKTVSYEEAVVSEYTVDEQGRYCFDFTGVNPQRMGDGINAVLYAQKDGAWYQHTLADGYSIRQYCVNRLNNSTDQEFKTLLSDLIAYGSAAQKYTGYDASRPVSDHMAADAPAYAPTVFSSEKLASIKKASGTDDAAVSLLAQNVELSNAVALVIKFNAADLNGLSVKAQVYDRTVTFSDAEIYTDGTYNQKPCDYIVFSDINATEYDMPITFTFWKNGQQAGRTLTTSVNSYIFSKYNSEDADFAGMVQNLYNYGVSAHNYINR